ncbi:MAG: outer membrane lipoprotein carrier protein LolA [Bacteroidetes bacterium 43-16]|nr:MAG: outer membrane lipoprotein carrier protein LolA [Bacteroidetes bacterium 43-16]
MKKLLGVMIAVVGLTTGAMAQQDAKAKVVLDKMSTKVKGMSSMKANFTLIATDAKGKTIMNQKGTLQMKGDKYNVALPKQEMICDGKTMWTYMKDNKEVQVAAYNEGEVQISPKKLFPTSYANEYNYTYVGEKSVKGKNVDVVYLTPKSKKNFKSVTLLVDKAGSLVSGSVEEGNGGYYTFNLNGIQANAAASDALYTFDKSKYPGVEVIDLR